MFDFLISHILKDSINPVANLIVNIARYANSAGFSQCFNSGRYVDLSVVLSQLLNALAVS